MNLSGQIVRLLVSDSLSDNYNDSDKRAGQIQFVRVIFLPVFNVHYSNGTIYKGKYSIPFSIFRSTAWITYGVAKYLLYIFLFIINFSKIGLINTLLTRKRDYCFMKFTRKQDYCLVKFTRKQEYPGYKDTKKIDSHQIMSRYFARNGVKTSFRAE